MLTHIAPETVRMGPLSCYAQWTLETAIRNLGREIRQDRDLFSNLAQRAILRAQLNSLQACFPGMQLDLAKADSSQVARNACVFDGYEGYAMLPGREAHPTPLTGDKLTVLLDYWQNEGWPARESWQNSVCRWAKLQLPNGQRARSVWYESGVAT